MAFTIGQVTIKIGADVKELERSISQAKRILNRSAAEFKSIGTTLSTSVSLPLLALGAASLKTFGELDSLKRGLTSVMGSAERAAKEFEKLREVAKLPGLGLEEAARGSVNLQSAGFSADQARSSLSAFGNALATVGKGKNELNLVVLALSQLQNKTSGFGQDLRQLVEQLPQLRGALTNIFGTADSEAIAKLGFTGKQVVEKLTVEFEKLPKVTGGFKNAFENATDSIKISLATLGESINKNLGIEKLLESISNGLNNLVTAFTNLSPEVQKGIVVTAGLAVALGPLSYAIGIVSSGLAGMLAYFSKDIIKAAELGNAALKAAQLQVKSTEKVTKAVAAAEIAQTAAAAKIAKANELEALASVTALANKEKALIKAAKATEIANVATGVAAVKAEKAAIATANLANATKASATAQAAASASSLGMFASLGAVAIVAASVAATGYLVYKNWDLVKEVFDIDAIPIKEVYDAVNKLAKLAPSLLPLVFVFQNIGVVVDGINLAFRLLLRTIQFITVSGDGLLGGLAAKANVLKSALFDVVSVIGSKPEAAAVAGGGKTSRGGGLDFSKAIIPTGPVSGGSTEPKKLSILQEALKDIKGVENLLKTGLITAVGAVQEKFDILYSAAKKAAKEGLFETVDKLKKKIVELGGILEPLQNKALPETIGNSATFATRFADEVKRAGEEMKKIGIIATDIKEPIETLTEKLKKISDAILKGIRTASDAIVPVLDSWGGLLDAQQGNLDARINNEKAAVQNSVGTEQDKASRLAAIDQKYHAEQTKLKRKQAVQQKAAGIYNALVSTGEGVARALALGPIGIPLAAVIGGLGLAQVAAIASTPLPSLAIGTREVYSDGLANIHRGEAIVPAKVAQGGFYESFKEKSRQKALEIYGKVSGTDLIFSTNNSVDIYSRLI